MPHRSFTRKFEGVGGQVGTEAGGCDRPGGSGDGNSRIGSAREEIEKILAPLDTGGRVLVVRNAHFESESASGSVRTGNVG